jgi:hypothetical protein
MKNSVGGGYILKFVYLSKTTRIEGSSSWWWKQIWNFKATKKMKLFM